MKINVQTYKQTSALGFLKKISPRQNGKWKRGKLSQQSTFGNVFLHEVEERFLSVILCRAGQGKYFFKKGKASKMN